MFLNRIFRKLKPHYIFPGDLLYCQGDIAEDIYFIMEGAITLYMDLSGVLNLPLELIDPLE